MTLSFAPILYVMLSFLKKGSVKSRVTFKTSKLIFFQETSRVIPNPWQYSGEYPCLSRRKFSAREGYNFFGLEIISPLFLLDFL